MRTRSCSKLDRFWTSAVAGVLLAIAVVPCGGAGTARAETIAEPSSGVQFDTTKTADGKSFTLVGVGLRKKFVVKVYAMALYVENVEGKRAFPSLATKAGGREKEKLTQGDRAQSFLIWGQFGKLAVLHFVRDVSAGQVRSAFEDGLAEELSDKASGDVREAAQGFLKMLDRDVKNGDELTLRSSPDGKLEVNLGGQAKGAVQNSKLVRALWGVWLGSKPISKELRADLVSRIAQLGE